MKRFLVYETCNICKYLEIINNDNFLIYKCNNEKKFNPKINSNYFDNYLYFENKYVEILADKSLIKGCKYREVKI